MSIMPLPVFEADADPRHRDALTDAEAYARLESPKTIVVRFGALKLVGEYPFGGDAKPGCGSKLVVRTHRGTEVGEMLTTTCENAGCGKSVTRQEMLDYIGESGGKEFPFHTKGRILRVATIEDLNEQSAISARKKECVRFCREQVAELGLDMKLVDAEPILGGELLTFYYLSESRIDFRDLVRSLATEFGTRIEMRQVGARDEARLTADYERCGQYCCCKSFLKVLKPVSMGAAKMQKATLDPLKISGRCGRLMCCLRYEDQTYRELKANLPHRKTRVGTSEGPGIVVDSKTLVQLVLVRLEEDGREIAVPIEELMDPETCPQPGDAPLPSEADPLRGMPADTVLTRTEKSDDAPPERRSKRRRSGRGKAGKSSEESREPRSGETARESGTDSSAGEPGAGSKKKKRSRRRRRGGKGPAGGGASSSSSPTPGASGDVSRGSAEGSGGEGGGAKKRRRRRRGGRGRGPGKSGGGGEGGGGG